MVRLFKAIVLITTGASALSIRTYKHFHNTSSDVSITPVMVAPPINYYIPVNVTCPSKHPTIRNASTGLSKVESSFISARRKAIVPAMHQFFATMDIPGFNAGKYISKHANMVEHLPNIGLAFSGGGYRAMLNGAGAFKAFDIREPSAKILGGLLQSSTYTTGVSGGSWLLSSVFLNNFTLVSTLQTPGPFWDLTTELFKPVGDDSVEGLLALYQNIYVEVEGRRAAGYSTSITDYWGRLLSQRFINATDAGVQLTWSGMKQLPGFAAHNLPLPIINAESRLDGQYSWTPESTTVFEFSPFEFGSWDSSISSFVDTEYIGSMYDNGKAHHCVRGYDQAGLVMGTSSSLYTTALVDRIDSLLPAAYAPMFDSLINNTKADGGFVAHYGPNPWKDWKMGASEAAGLNDDVLHLVDGGTDGQAIPIHPLIQPAREVDVIIAIDSTNDVNGWPNGTTLIASSIHAKSTLGNKPFPEIPDTNTFVNLGLNKRPTFFGCNSTAPLIVYIPNTPYTTFSNTSTYQLAYSNEQRDAMIDNGFLAATQGNGTASAEFKVCLGCALLGRSLEMTNTPIPSACKKCFSAYCWNGTYASDTPIQPYEPELLGAELAGNGLNLGNSSGNGTNAGSRGKINMLSVLAVATMAAGMI